VTTTPPPPPDAEAVIDLAFAPLHKRAFGTAVGSAGAVLVFAVTAVDVLVKPEPGLNLPLLAEYFYGYSVTWSGAVVGALWGGFVGFVAGWFVAFARNLALAVTALWIRSKSELSATRDFLDHI